MTVAVVGAGKLGLPLAFTFEHVGHEVLLVEKDPARQSFAWFPDEELDEDGMPIARLLTKSKMRYVSLETAVANAEIVFVVVDTPSSHGPVGCDRILSAPYDYSALESVLGDLQNAALVAVCSTTAPGYLAAKWDSKLPLVHVPQFSAMGMVVPETLDPEFQVIGSSQVELADVLYNFYSTIHHAPIFRVSLTEAELIKTTYNGALTWKINYANWLGLLCEELGANADNVTTALQQAKRRIWSWRYFRSGGGDGGGCHPKENAMLAALANDLFGDVANPWEFNMSTRVFQADYVVDRILELTDVVQGPIYLLGKAFKKQSSITLGSYPLLVGEILQHEVDRPVRYYDPYTDDLPELESGVYALLTNHDEFKSLELPPGSVVLDLWGIIPEQPMVLVKRLGR